MRSLLAAVFALAIIAALISAPSATAQEPAAGVISARIDPVVATVGDRLTLTIVVEHTPGMSVFGPEEGADFGQAVFIETAEPSTIREAANERTTLTYTLTSFVVGQHEIPPLPIRIEDGTFSATLTTPAAPYTIDTVLQPGDTSLRPLKPQLSIPEPAPPPFIPGTFVALMAALTGLGYWLVRRALRVQPAAAAVAPVPTPDALPEDTARGALDQIAASGLIERDVPEYYARIAATLRQYLSERYDVPAYAMTRREIERGMEAGGLDRWPARLAANLLEQCEAAEFAKFVPAPRRREQDLAAAYEIIRLASSQAEGDDSG